MKKRPERFTLLAIILFAIALSLPLQITWMFEQSPLELRLLAAQMAPMNWIVFAVALVTGWLALRASPLLLAALPVLSLAVIYNNWLVARSGLNASVEIATASAIGLLLFVGYCLDSPCIRLLLHPELRWWLTPTRYPVSVTMHMQGIRARTFDLSSTGAFVPLNQVEADPIKVGNRLLVTIPLNEESDYLECHGEVVRKCEANGRYPAGVGIRFDGLNWREQRALDVFIRQQAEAQGADKPRPGLSHLPQ